MTGFYNKSKICMAILTLFCGFIFLFRAYETIVGIQNGLFLCTNTIIPSLFCFMILTNFILLSGLNHILSVPLSLFTRFFLKLDKSLGCIILMSLVGGYPIGASSLAELLRKKEVSLKTAQRMLGFCCCAGPSFVITAVGRGMFSNINTGVALYFIQVASAFLLGIMSSIGIGGVKNIGGIGDNFKNSYSNKNSNISDLSYANAFVTAVKNSVCTMANMCGYILFFSAVLELVKGTFSGTVVAIISGILEVTNGCRTASALPGVWSLGVTSFFLSFGGISVFCQLAGILKDSGINMKNLLFYRIIHGAISFTMAIFYGRLNPAIVPTFSQMGVAVPVVSKNTPILTICLLMMCSILLISVKLEKSPNYDSIFH